MFMKLKHNLFSAFVYMQMFRPPHSWLIMQNLRLDTLFELSMVEKDSSEQELEKKIISLSSSSCSISSKHASINSPSQYSSSICKNQNNCEEYMTKSFQLN